MPPDYLHSISKRKSALGGISLSSESRAQSRQPGRSSLSPASSKLKDRSGHAICADRPRTHPQTSANASLHGRSQKEKTQSNNRALTREARHLSHQQRLGPDNQQKNPYALKAKDILKHPRLQQVTGFLPRNAKLWKDRELPADELSRLAWAMTLPEPFPSKRPRGNF
ncbi:hypothetical protein F5Y19DRAFT_473846 [Xylariaceae sp. FL1651]|nr:hypothetical protein F5Y19DRAFT_473846 [Xylariaceae sp. FL1651]